VHTLDFGKAQARAASGEWGGGDLWGLYVMKPLSMRWCESMSVPVCEIP
jgi:hypothetical protein